MKSRPTKLFVDVSPLAEDHLTGIPHFTASLVSALDQHPEHGKTFQLVLVMPFDKASKLGRWRYQKAKILRVPLPLRLFNLLWKYQLLPPIDLLFGQGVFLFPNYKNWPLARSACLTYIHDLGYIRFPESVQPKNLAFLRQGVKRWTGRSDLVLTGSDHARQEIHELLGIDLDRIVRIYHGVEHEAYHPRGASEVHRAKTKYGLEGEYILHIGSFEPRKNLTRLVEAYQQLPAKMREQHGLCLVGGGGWLNDEIFAAIDQAKAAGSKILCPNRYIEDTDLPAIISGASLLVHPALYEGFGLPPLQAMACGVPVAVADNSSLPEVVGEAAVRFDAQDTSDMSAKIEAVLSDPAYHKRLVAKGLEQARKFDWFISASQVIDCFKRVADQNV